MCVSAISGRSEHDPAALNIQQIDFQVRLRKMTLYSPQAVKSEHIYLTENLTFTAFLFAKVMDAITFAPLGSLTSPFARI